MNLCSISFPEWKLEERLQVMKDIGIEFDRIDQMCINIKDIGMSSGEREAFDFLRDPVHPVKFHIFDYHFGKIILKLHTEFWTWRFYPDGR